MTNKFQVGKVNVRITSDQGNKAYLTKIFQNLCMSVCLSDSKLLMENI